MTRPASKLALAASIAVAFVSGGAIASDVSGAAANAVDRDDHFIGRAIGPAAPARGGFTIQTGATDQRVRASRISVGGQFEQVEAPAIEAPAIEGNDANAGNASAVVSKVVPELSPANVDAPASTRQYIIGFAEAPVASAGGAVPRLETGRIDVASLEAANYAQGLEQLQELRERNMGRVLGRQLRATHRMQHAFNGIIVELTDAEAEQLAQMPDVSLMEPYHEYALDTDVGPYFINADQVWENGSAFPGSTGALGEGVVFGIIDSGANAGSPSFAATDMLGYTHTNPLGEGVYLGTCVEGGIDEGRCNSKLIGGYDFICTLTTICEDPALREVPGFRDENGHGTHVGATVAGNFRTATFQGNEVELSGVAPRGNLVFFDACYTNAAGQGLCPNVSTLASINQAVADGVVDALSYSIGGGGSPWTEAISLAFLSAVDAGIFVSASGGNSGPGAATVGHRQPWVHTIAAGQHGRGAFAFQAILDSDGEVPGSINPLILTPGGGGVAFTTGIPAGTEVIVSPGIDSGDDGCAAFPAGTFEDAIAVVRRGTCPFSDKVNNADAAGAIAVIIANNQAGTLSPSVPGTGIPAFLITQANADTLRDFAAGNDVTAGISAAAAPQPNTPDQLAGFSSRGPVQFDLIKPDLTAPGVLILAADAGPEPDGFEALVGLKSGTSMSQPHNAGAAGLVRQLNPGWSVPEIKSALMMTAEPSVLLEDGVTPANPFAGGSGSLRVDRAVRAGLVMHETTENYLAANPTLGGDPSSLNLPSMASANCAGSCTFTRTFRSVTPLLQNNPVVPGGMRGRGVGTQSYTVTLEGLDGEVSQPSFSVLRNGTVSLDITIDASSLPANGQFNFGTVVLTPFNADLPTLRLPVAVAVPPPVIDIDPAVVSLTVPVDGSGQAVAEVGNIGGGTLEFDVVSGEVTISVLDQPRGGVTSGARAGIWNDGANASFVTDDFVVAADTAITSISAEGFTQGAVIGTGASQIVFEIYPDAGGVPSGDPFGLTDGEPVWSYAAAPGSPGLTTTAANTISLNLDAAGQSVDLEAGTYWLVVYSVTETIQNNWVWFYSAAPQAGQRPHSLTAGGWAPVGGTFNALNALVQGELGCGASWISGVSPADGQVASGDAVEVEISVDATGLAPGSYSAVVCLESNSSTGSSSVIGVNLTVTGD
ncbi:MAG: S8 family serine peptidase [Lysobacteraceae bacterium]